MRKLEVKIRQIIWAFIQTFSPTNGDKVLYKNKTYFIKSSLTGNDIWNLFDVNDSNNIVYKISGKKLTVIQSFKRFVTVFNQHMRFQKISWELIDQRNPIGTRLSYINSDNIVFN
jgi:hypothetical protein